MRIFTSRERFVVDPSFGCGKMGGFGHTGLHRVQLGVSSYQMYRLFRSKYQVGFKLATKRDLVIKHIFSINKRLATI